jgi:23S rRNA pseudouridine2605 synthase
MSGYRDAAGKMRLQKFLSDAGVASRRNAELMVESGRVLINDEIVHTLPAFVDPENDRVVVDGNVVRMQPQQYWIIHKPKGVVTTMSDPAGRRRAVDFLPPMRTRLFVVGRLDPESSGLLLMTNDGELAQRISHPRYGIPKVYWAEVRGDAGLDLPAVMRKGVFLSEGRASVSDVQILHRTREQSALSITLCESHNRQVRRMLAKLGHPVRNLKCTNIGPIELKHLPLGSSRSLTPHEVSELRRAISQAVAADSRPAKRGRRVGGTRDGDRAKGAAPALRGLAPRRPGGAGRSDGTRGRDRKDDGKPRRFVR